MDNEAGRDLLSNLPLSIVHLILALVPIEDAIRTSLLSKQWRYTWTSIPHLRFSDDGADWYSLPNPLQMQIRERTNKFISQVLLLHKGSIHRFEMSYPYNFEILNDEEWLLCLSRNDIRELIIKVYWEPGNDVNWFSSTLSSCTKLTKLEIWNFTMAPPPSTFKGFLFLTTLVLEEVTLSPDRVESLIASCPLLERLTIMDYQSCNPSITITAPNLKYMYLIGEYTELSVYAPLLAEMYVELDPSSESELADENQSLVCNYAIFLGGCTNLVELRGRKFFMRYLSIGIKFCHSTLVFHHLKHIELSDVDFEDRSEMAAVARLIIGAPNLHKLKISAVLVVGDEPGAPDVSFVDFGFAPNFKLEKLRVVSLPYTCRYGSGMQLIEFLLESSPVLETMRLRFIKRNHFHSAVAELPWFRRASANARILLSFDR